MILGLLHNTSDSPAAALAQNSMKHNGLINQTLNPTEIFSCIFIIGRVAAVAAGECCAKAVQFEGNLN